MNIFNVYANYFMYVMGVFELKKTGAKGVTPHSPLLFQIGSIRPVDPTFVLFYRGGKAFPSPSRRVDLSPISLVQLKVPGIPVLNHGSSNPSS